MARRRWGISRHFEEQQFEVLCGCARRWERDLHPFFGPPMARNAAANAANQLAKRYGLPNDRSETVSHFSTTMEAVPPSSGRQQLDRCADYRLSGPARRLRTVGAERAWAPTIRWLGGAAPGGVEPSIQHSDTLPRPIRKRRISGFSRVRSNGHSAALAPAVTKRWQLKTRDETGPLRDDWWRA